MKSATAVLWPSLRQFVVFANSVMATCLEIGLFALKFHFHKPREIWLLCQQMTKQLLAFIDIDASS